MEGLLASFILLFCTTSHREFLTTWRKVGLLTFLQYIMYSKEGYSHCGMVVSAGTS